MQKTLIQQHQLFLFAILLVVSSTGLRAQQETDFSGAPEGLIEPLREQTLGAVVLGKLATVHVKEGDAVAAGEILLEMDTDLQELELERRRLAMDMGAELKFARLRASVLQEELESTQELFEKSRSVSREEINRKTLDYQMAVSELERLEQEAQLAKVEYEMAKKELEQRRIRAPHAGTITSIQIEESEICRPGQPLISMVDISQCYLKCHVDPEVAESLHHGRQVTVVVPLATEWIRIPGMVDLIAPTVDAASGLRRIRILFENPDNRVSPGMAAYALLEDPTH